MPPTSGHHQLSGITQIFRDLSMDPMAANFIETKINGVSNLVNVRNVAAALDLLVAHAAEVYSQSANFFASAAAFNAALAAASGTHLVLEIDGLTTAPIDISAATNAAQIATQINTALTAQSVAADVSGTLVNGGLRLAATSIGTRSVRVVPAPSNDISAELGLGASNGGIEVGLYSALRPEMTGISSRIFAAPGVITALLNIASAAGNPARTASFNDGGANTDVVWGVASPDLTTIRLRSELDSLVAVLNASALEDTWVFDRIGMRIRGLRLDGAQAQSEAATLAGDAAALNASAVRASYALGQDGGAAGVDGTAPVLADYLDYYQTIARKVSIFNMMILPRGHGQTDLARSSIWGAASSFCRDENALLIIDPRSDNTAWSDVFEITDEAEVTDFKSGILPQVSCTFWPRVRTPLGKSQVHIDPAGTIAGVMAATIAKSGVWNTAAGLGAPLSGVTGLEYGMTDAENGVINPRGINALRAKSTGNVVWGGRTLAGDDAFADRDFAYISVRMTTDFIKNSISRALESFVFKNNNADTWAQIEMMCRAFLHDLYKKGAFRGTKVDDAYEARCNNLTTSPTDIQLGIMNVWVKFAPNFPAEFIHLHIQHKFEQPSF